MEFKKLSAVEMVEAVDQAATVLIEKDGVIKRAPKNEVNVQADWAETDSSSPAFIKNKPVEEYVLDLDVTCNYDPDADDWAIDYNVNKIDTYANIKNRIFNGELQKCKCKTSCQEFGNENSGYTTEVIDGLITCNPEIDGGDPEHIAFGFWGFNIGCIAVLTPDDVLQGVFLN